MSIAQLRRRVELFEREIKKIPEAVAKRAFYAKNNQELVEKILRQAIRQALRRFEQKARREGLER